MILGHVWRQSPWCNKKIFPRKQFTRILNFTVFIYTINDTYELVFVSMRNTPQLSWINLQIFPIYFIQICAIGPKVLAVQRSLGDFFGQMRRFGVCPPGCMFLLFLFLEKSVCGVNLRWRPHLGPCYLWKGHKRPARVILATDPSVYEIDDNKTKNKYMCGCDIFGNKKKRIKYASLYEKLIKTHT